MNIPDNYDAFCRHDAEQERKLTRLPVCIECGEPIQDDFLFDINGDLFCENCMQDVFRKSREDYER